MKNLDPNYICFGNKSGKRLIETICRCCGKEIEDPRNDKGVCSDCQKIIDMEKKSDLAGKSIG